MGNSQKAFTNNALWPFTHIKYTNLNPTFRCPAYMHSIMLTEQSKLIVLKLSLAEQEQN